MYRGEKKAHNLVKEATFLEGSDCKLCLQCANLGRFMNLWVKLCEESPIKYLNFLINNSLQLKKKIPLQYLEVFENLLKKKSPVLTVFKCGTKKITCIYSIIIVLVIVCSR